MPPNASEFAVSRPGATAVIAHISKQNAAFLIGFGRFGQPESVFFSEFRAISDCFMQPDALFLPFGDVAQKCLRMPPNSVGPGRAGCRISAIFGHFSQFCAVLHIYALIRAIWVRNQ